MYTLGIVQINPVIGAVDAIVAHVVERITYCRERGAKLIIFPELVLVGYPPRDLLLFPECVSRCERAVEEIAVHTQGVTVIVGTVRPAPKDERGKGLYNSAAVLSDGKLCGYQDKILLPTYDVFDEQRYFRTGSEQRVWDIAGKKVGITICEDIWPQLQTSETYPIDPLTFFEGKIDLLVNLSASPYSRGKIDRRKQLVSLVAQRMRTPVALVNQVGGNDSLLFDGTSVLYMPTGELAYQAMSFAEDTILMDVDQLSRIAVVEEGPESELFFALVMGLRDYFVKQKFGKAILGLSGGVDSALVACIAAIAFGRRNITAFLMPSQFTSVESIEDALIVADALGVSTIEVPLDPILGAYDSVLSPLFHGVPPGLAEENIQSRIRANILMYYANKEPCLVLNTGNKSESSVGYTTLYGDSAGAVAVIGDLMKEEVYELAHWISKNFGWIPPRVLTRPPTAELRHNQKDTDSIPPYEVLDVIIQEHLVQRRPLAGIAEQLKMPVDEVQKIVRLIYRNEFKRRQSPPSLRVSEQCFSAGRQIPICQGFW